MRRPRRILSHAIRGGLIICGLACAQPPGSAPSPDPASERAALTPQASGTTALLQAVSVVDGRSAWVSGHAGTWARTTDGGATWRAGHVPGADTLQFRDVHALSADVAWLLAAGPGDMSRIYHTTDGGRSWTLQHTNTEAKGFYDCFAFWDARHGVIFGDQVNGRTAMLETTDGGAYWSEIPASRVPAPAGNEGAFAASGTCVATLGGELGWITTGAGSAARIFRTADRGAHWAAVPTPIAAAAMAGLATVAFRDPQTGVAAGGEMGNPRSRTDNVVQSADGGRTWTLAARPPFLGAVYGVAYAVGTRPPMLVAVGPGGMALSRDDARSWKALDTLAYWSIGLGRDGVGWAVGPKGRITRIDLGARRSR